MSFNPLKEKGIPLDKQLRNWKQVAARHYDKRDIEAYSRTRQILMNGIEVEAWNFKHNLVRMCPDNEVNKIIAMSRRIEDQQQTTINWLIPHDQTVLETTLGYEQVAVDLTAWLAQNEPDPYVKETFDFGLLEDFDHLYKYSQWAYTCEGLDPDKILHGLTDVFPSRPTQNHHNDNWMRLRKHYDKIEASPQTKVNIMTLVAGEQQTHNYYAEHGMMYGNNVLRCLFGEICDVEEEHVTMYETLADPTETVWEKLVLHEYCEVCNYYTCYKDETNDKLKLIWEEFLAHEIEHLRVASEFLKKFDKKDPEEVIGTKVFEPCHFESQKEYVASVLENEIDKRLDGTDEMGYTTIEELPNNWPSYAIQKLVSEEGAPSEQTTKVIAANIGRDLVLADDELKDQEIELLERGYEKKALAPNTVMPKELEKMIETAPDEDIFETEIN